MAEECFNNKIALIVGASSESLYAINCAKKLGFNVIAFDGNKDAEGLFVADKSFVVDIRNSNNIIEKLKDVKPNVVLPIPIGSCLTTSGAINDYYNLKGISEKACNNCVDKYVFHQILAKNNLRDCECNLINLTNYIEPKSYPVIVKPRYGSGSRMVIRIDNQKDFKKNYEQVKAFNEDFICETCVKGQEYGIDASVINEKFNLVLLRKKEITAPPYCQCLGYYSVVPEDNVSLVTRIKEYMQELVKVLNINNCLLHADIIDNGTKSFIIELSPRPSGHNLHNNYTKIATNIDMVENYINFAMNNDINVNFKPQITKPTLISYFNFEDCVVKKVPNKEYLLNKYPLKKYICNLNEGDFCTKIINGPTLMQRGYYILQGNNDKELKLLRNSLLNEFEVEYG